MQQYNSADLEHAETPDGHRVPIIPKDAGNPFTLDGEAHTHDEVRDDEGNLVGYIEKKVEPIEAA